MRSERSIVIIVETIHGIITVPYYLVLFQLT